MNLPKVSFRRAKGYVWGDETWSLRRSTLSFRSAKAMLSQNEEWRMKSEESCFTQFNFSFITFPRQDFVNLIDNKMKTVHARCTSSSYVFGREVWRVRIIGVMASSALGFSIFEHKYWYINAKIYSEVTKKEKLVLHLINN